MERGHRGALHLLRHDRRGLALPGLGALRHRPARGHRCTTASSARSTRTSCSATTPQHNPWLWAGDPRRVRAGREPRPPRRLAAQRGPGAQRPADRPGQPHPAGGDHPPGARAAAVRSACCSSTSTTSRTSTTAAATPPATSCCSCSPSGCAAASAPVTWSPASAATSSPSSWTAGPTSPGRSASGCSPRSPLPVAAGRRRGGRARQRRHRRRPATPASARPARCCATPTSRCTWPRRRARTGWSSTPTAWPRPPAVAPTCAQDLDAPRSPGQLVVHYQPIVRLRRRPDDGLRGARPLEPPRARAVPPVEFIPLAEETGAITGIGRWVLRRGAPPGRRVVGRDRRAAADGRQPLARASSRTATSSPTSSRRSRRPGSRPAQLTLEVTEGVLVRDVDAVVGQLEALRALGIRIAIDDFGTGFSGAVLPAAPARRHPQDRPQLRQRPAAGRSATHADHLDRRAGPHARPGRRRRGRRDRGAAPGAARPATARRRRATSSPVRSRPSRPGRPSSAASPGRGRGPRDRPSRPAVRGADSAAASSGHPWARRAANSLPALSWWESRDEGGPGPGSADRAGHSPPSRVSRPVSASSSPSRGQTR